MIIPGFGGFIGNYTPARIDKITGTFYPPVKLISFNRNLNHNDGLLIKVISEKKGLNYGDARNIAEEFVSGIRKKLDRGEIAEFEKIGVFSNNKEGNLQFEPDTTVNYHPDSFGLEAFTCSPLENYDLRKRISGNGINHPARQYKLRKYIWRAAVILPIAAALVYVSVETDFFRNKIETVSLNPLVTAELDNNKAVVEQEIAANIINESISSIDESKASGNESNDEIVNPVIENTTPSIGSSTPVIENVSTYYIITGSFKSVENAGKQVSQLQSEGFNPELITAENGFYRVCALKCNNLSAAVSKKDSLLKKFPTAWISGKK